MSSLGGPPPSGNDNGSSLGGPPAGASLGGATLGGAPPPSSSASKKKRNKKKAGSNATPAPATTGASLGGPPPSGASLGAPPAAGSSLGGPPAAGSSLGGPPPSTGAALGAPPSTGAALGAPPSSGASLGGSALGGAALGAPTGSALGGAALGGTPAATESASSKKKNKKKKKKAAEKPAPVEKKQTKQSKMAALIKKQQEEEAKRKEEEERLRKEEEERLKREEEEREKEKEKAKQVKKVKKEKKKENDKLKQQLATIQRLKASGMKLPPALQKLDDQANGIFGDDVETQSPSSVKHQQKVDSAKIKKAKQEKLRKEEEQKRKEEEALNSKDNLDDDDGDDDWDAMYNSDGEIDDNPKPKSEIDIDEDDKIDKIDDPLEIVEGEMRSPICCVLGHVDTGKTLLLDKIRRSNVQRGEAGGITQQIGATYFPLDSIKKLTGTLNEGLNLQYKVPGLLIIDTPGHESFTNLRSRGSSLCDIAVLVVDINHGIEQQTEESIKLLRKRKTPFVVALNKIDRIFEWKEKPNAPIRESLKDQKPNVVTQYDKMVEDTKTLFAERGMNSSLYYKNKDFRNVVSIVPTSAVTGEGIPDLVMLLVQLTQKMLKEQLFLSPQLKCTILEIKVVEGLGTTADVIVSDGILKEGDTIVLCGMHGPIVTTIRALLTPPPLKEIRVKAGKGNPYIHCKTIKAAMGVKIVAHDLHDAVAGSQLLVAGPDEDIDELKEEVQMDLKKLQKSVSTTARGVFVQSSTLGSLEALLSYLKENKIPVAAVGIGPIHKRDVTRASVMLEHDKTYACILAFDVKIEKDAQKFAEKLGVKIFSAEIIYHLSDMFLAHLKAIDDEKRRQFAGEAVWPVVLEVYIYFIYFI